MAELIAATTADPERRRAELDCHAGDDQALPLECDGDELGALAEALVQVGLRNGVRLAVIRARLVYPAEINALCEYHGTKGAALSHVTLAPVRRVVDEVAGGGDDVLAGGGDAPARLEEIQIYLDKHGGRNRYAELVQHHFADSWIDVLDEGRTASRYAWTHGASPIEAVFRVGCEAMLPTALASMTAKYHRELAMRAFNAWWAERIPGLRPTCGYPGDAHRFKADIAAVQQELAIDDQLLWRCR